MLRRSVLKWPADSHGALLQIGHLRAVHPISSTYALIEVHFCPQRLQQPMTQAQQVADCADDDLATTDQFCATGGTTYASTAILSATYRDSTNAGPGSLTIMLLT